MDAGSVDPGRLDQLVRHRTEECRHQVDVERQVERACREGSPSRTCRAGRAAPSRRRSAPSRAAAGSRSSRARKVDGGPQPPAELRERVAGECRADHARADRGRRDDQRVSEVERRCWRRSRRVRTRRGTPSSAGRSSRSSQSAWVRNAVAAMKRSGRTADSEKSAIATMTGHERRASEARTPQGGIGRRRWYRSRTLNAPPRGSGRPDLEEADHEDDAHEHHADRGGIAHVLVRERLLVDVELRDVRVGSPGPPFVIV